MANTDTTFFDRGTQDRWYRDPGNATRTWPGVSGILNARRKGGLEGAKQKGIREYAARNRKMLAEMNQAEVITLLKTQNVILPDWRVGADYGTQVHQVIENLVAGKPYLNNVVEVEGTDKYPVTNEWGWVVDNWNEFVAKYNVVVLYSEEMVINDTLRYAGRFDLIVEMDGDPFETDGRVVVILDIKSNAKGPHGDVAVQNTAYGKAEFIVDMETGKRTPMPKVTHSAVLWMHDRPALSEKPGWNLCPLRFDAYTWKVLYSLVTLYGFAAAGEHEVILPATNGPELFERYQPRG
jgi:hypothetical protein